MKSFSVVVFEGGVLNSYILVLNFKNIFYENLYHMFEITIFFILDDISNNV
jgi:hypothetical protein